MERLSFLLQIISNKICFELFEMLLYQLYKMYAASCFQSGAIKAGFSIT